MTDRWVTFDCYGTLIDWERGIADTFASLWPGADAQALLGRYHRIEPDVQRGSTAPYRDVLTESLRRVAAVEGLDLGAADAGALAASLPSWPPFPEVPAALRELRQRGWRMAVLSNTDPDLLDASVAALGVDVDLRVTVVEAGTYKPAPGHWKSFFAQTGAERTDHAHVAASVFHDIQPAHELGLRAVWINRAGEHSEVPRTAELPDLGDLPDTLDALGAPD